ncbi:MFS transporter [Chitinibacter tainanensis]|uniref:MFS transporter n=1 Tax=Chitinibacter tainanensis TaxID=230667 RepID=UPI0003FE5F1D|nr:MFS transporter [Chitinibacter tainanensis]
MSWLNRIAAPFRGLPRSVYIQATATLINNMGGMAKLFLPLYFREHFNLSYAHIGWLMGVYGLGLLGGSYLGGLLSDRYDSRRIAKLMLLASGVLTLLLAAPLPIWAYVPLLLAVGTSDGAFRPANMRLVLEPVRPEQRAVAQGVYRIAFNLGVSAAGISGGLLAALGYHYVFVAQGIAALLACGWLQWAWREMPYLNSGLANSKASSPDMATGSPWQDRAFLLFVAGQLVILTVFDQMYGTLGLFLREHYRLSPSWLGYLFTLNGLMVVTLQVAIANRVSHWGLLRSSMLGVLCMGGSFTLLNAGQHAGWAIAMMVVLTLGELLISPTWTTIIMQHTEQRQRGRYLGIYSAVWSGRTLYAPTVGAFSYAIWGASVTWWLCGLLALITCALHRPALRQMLAPAN